MNEGNPDVEVVGISGVGWGWGVGEEYLRGKINYVATGSKNVDIEELRRGVNEFKKITTQNYLSKGQEK
jgi:hypothetical protein